MLTLNFDYLLIYLICSDQLFEIGPMRFSWFWASLVTNMNFSPISNMYQEFFSSHPVFLFYSYFCPYIKNLEPFFFFPYIKNLECFFWNFSSSKLEKIQKIHSKVFSKVKIIQKTCSKIFIQEQKKTNLRYIKFVLNNTSNNLGPKHFP
jgi:hypothetical protein